MSRQDGAGGGLAGTAAGSPDVGIVSRVQVLGLASAHAVAERCIETLDRYLARRDGPGVLAPLGGAGPAPGPQAPETLELPAVPAGGSTEAFLWLHNPTAAPVRAGVRVSPLTSAEGHLVPAPTVAEEATGAEVGAGGSLQVRVTVRVPAGTPPGHYHGVATSRATPRQGLPVVVQVQGPPAEDSG